MARKDEALAWLRKGYSPKDIAGQMEINIRTVMSYLYHHVGEGIIRRSDVLLSFDEETRDTIERLISETGTTSFRRLRRMVVRSGNHIDHDELRIYLKLRDARATAGDMCEYLRTIDTMLHFMVKDALIMQYGSVDWWRKGVPESVRVECAVCLEQNPNPASHAYCYTDFIQLRDILHHQWDAFTTSVRGVAPFDKLQFLQVLSDLERIRKGLMYPQRCDQPTADDLAVVRTLAHKLKKLAGELNDEL